MKMKKAVYESEFGWIQIHYHMDQVLGIALFEAAPKGVLEPTEFTDLVFNQLKQYFEGGRLQFDFKYQLIGTEFQKRVWEALIKIPYGETRSYKQIAKEIGNEKASRAVGLANNRNPLLFIVPCHRVIGSNGGMVGYAGGIERKKKLLEMEKKKGQ